MFSTLLIANRGEIACRILRTARRMGLRTVAVASDADRDAPHARLADECVLIGPAPAAQSYLSIERIVDACRRTGADAVHPGYGFLSENPRFCAALEAEGIAFVGPDVRAIASMGDKIESKRLAAAAGVRSVPGRLEALADADEAAAVARDIGYPVMIKASAGGGGKGMRIAHDDASLREGYVSARNEARAAFGDDRVFVEKYVEQPRHIEIQVLGDAHGNIVHLGERECSIQRRHQKVIEEAPSPLLDPATRAAMGAQAVTLARAVGYRSAGTVEFIVDAERRFYFLEMNTRLQVEHPVTEKVTGLDLVELMIRIAAGEALPFGQDDVRLDGWAVEARLYAEDPARGFLPSTGRLTRYRPPADPGLRVDSGVEEGSEVSPFYDPMLAKVITAGRDRAEAVARMRTALDGFVVRGVRHNLGFLGAVLAHPRFAEGRLSTRFLEEEFPAVVGASAGTAAPSAPSDAAAADPTADRLVAVAAALHRRVLERECRTGGKLPGYRGEVPAEMVVRTGRANRPVRVEAAGDAVRVVLDGRAVRVEGRWSPGDALFDGTVDGEAFRAQVEPAGIGWRLTAGGAALEASVLTARTADLAGLMPVKAAPDLSRFLLSPMPGLLVSLSVEPGQRVQAGATVAVVEAMKMENILRAARDGVVAALHAAAGDSLAVDQRIVEFE